MGCGAAAMENEKKSARLSVLVKSYDSRAETANTFRGRRRGMI
jgi:hypothetical protein